MIIRSPRRPDRIRLIAIETMKGAFGIEGALRFFTRQFAKEIAYASFQGCDAARQGEPLKFGIDNEQPKSRNSPNQDLEPAETLFCLGEHPPSFRPSIGAANRQQEENFYEKSASNHQFNLLN
jgi:hypothetical protein